MSCNVYLVRVVQVMQPQDVSLLKIQGRRAIYPGGD